MKIVFSYAARNLPAARSIPAAPAPWQLGDAERPRLKVYAAAQGLAVAALGFQHPIGAAIAELVGFAAVTILLLICLVFRSLRVGRPGTVALLAEAPIDPNQIARNLDTHGRVRPTPKPPKAKVVAVMTAMVV